MALTAAQKLTLKNAILADAALANQPQSDEGTTVIKAALDAEATPLFYVWRTRLLKSDYTDKTGPNATVFSWVEYIARNQGERDAFEQLFGRQDSINPALPQVRQAMADMFSGPGGLPNRTHFTDSARRVATRFEKLFATGTGTTADPATMVLESPISKADIEAARNS